MVFKRSVDEIAMISKSCQIVADTIDMITEFVVPGCLVSELDKKAENYCSSVKLFCCASLVIASSSCWSGIRTP